MSKSNSAKTGIQTSSATQRVVGTATLDFLQKLAPDNIGPVSASVLSELRQEADARKMDLQKNILLTLSEIVSVEVARLRDIRKTEQAYKSNIQKLEEIGQAILKGELTIEEFAEVNNLAESCMGSNATGLAYALHLGQLLSFAPGKG